MPIIFQCHNCGNLLVVRHLRVGEMAKCKECGAVNTVPQPSNEEELEEHQKPIDRNLHRDGALDKLEFNFNQEYHENVKEVNRVALIKCPDCGREISSLAPACPGCGRPQTIKESLPSGTNESTRTLPASVLARNGVVPQSETAARLVQNVEEVWIKPVSVQCAKIKQGIENPNLNR